MGRRSELRQALPGMVSGPIVAAMHKTLSMRAVLLLALTAVASSCTVVKPLACALVYPVHEFGKRLKHDANEDEHSDLPAAGVIVAAPVLIPLNYVYYTLYGAVGGLVSGVVSDLNMIVGHGTLRTSRQTIFQPLKTNAVK